MAFKGFVNPSVAINDIISTIITELTANGWTSPDPGYDVVRNPTAVFDVFMFLEPTNKRYLQVQVGTWNTGTHVMNTPYVTTGSIWYDSASGIPLAGTELGSMRISYDTTYAILMMDYKGNGTYWRTCLHFIGRLTPLVSADACTVSIAWMYNASNPHPDYDGINVLYQFKILEDMSGAPNKPKYNFAYVSQHPAAPVSSTPRGLSRGFPEDKRRLCPFWAASGAQVTGGENSGIRALFPSICSGYYEDTETNGQTMTDDTGKTWIYLVNSDPGAYSTFFARLWVRIA